MDSFTTKVTGDIYYYSRPGFRMLGFCNGKLNHSIAPGELQTNAAIYGKLDYVTQSYDGEGFNGGPFENAEFNGINLKTVISL